MKSCVLLRLRKTLIPHSESSLILNIVPKKTTANGLSGYHCKSFRLCTTIFDTYIYIYSLWCSFTMFVRRMTTFHSLFLLRCCCCCFYSFRLLLVNCWSERVCHSESPANHNNILFAKHIYILITVNLTLKACFLAKNHKFRFAIDFFFFFSFFFSSFDSVCASFYRHFYFKKKEIKKCEEIFVFLFFIRTPIFQLRLLHLMRKSVNKEKKMYTHYDHSNQSIPIEFPNNLALR